MDEDPYGSASPSRRRVGPKVGSAMSLHNGPVVDAVEAVELLSKHLQAEPEGNTGNRMPPVTLTPGKSEAPLNEGILSDPSPAGGRSSQPQRPALYPPT